MPFIGVGDENIYYDFSPSENGQVLVAIHGSGGNHTHWPKGFRMLKKAAVYAVDLPGHGQSSGQGRNNVDAYSDFIDSFVAKLKLKNVTLIGHSLGGAIAQLLALRSPPWLTQIILVGTGARLRVHPDILGGLLSDFETTIDVICKWAYSSAASEALINRGREGFLNTPPTVIHGDYSACNQFDIMDKVGEIRLPTLILSGTEDKLTPVKYGKFLHHHVLGSTLITIKDAGHMMFLEKPVEFIRSISDFLGFEYP